MIFNLENFTVELAQEFSNKLERNEIESLLGLKEQYSKDTPISTGKRLTLTHLSFRGAKSTDETKEYSGSEIDYQQQIYTGVNMWIADNLKGKSSIFKVIKFALTGSSSLKPNIKSWINEIILNFNISDKCYTIYMDSKKRLRAYLYNGTFRSYEELQASIDDPIIEAKSEKEYEELIQEFFFKQFSYYSLKWTQRHPSRDKNELLEVGASWTTYFMSMLLESKDSGEMYGAQGKKIFEMLLGLELTYPLNQLKVKADVLNDQKAKEILFADRAETSTTTQLATLEEELAKINSSIAEFERLSIQKSALTNLYDEYSQIINQIKEENDKALGAEKDIQNANKGLNIIKAEQQRISQEQTRIDNEILKVKRNLSDLNEYLEIGIFFSNLNIKQCPNCSHEISEQKKKEVAISHKCYVCDNSIEESSHNDNPEIYEEKIQNLEKLLQRYQEEKLELESAVSKSEAAFIDQYEEIKTLEARRTSLNRVTILTNQLREVEDRILQEKANKEDEEERSRLISDRAVIQYQISQIQDAPKRQRTEEKINDKILLLNAAIEKLNEMRFSTGQRIIKRLSELMLSELHLLGLTSVSEIHITDKLDIQYKQDGEFITFNQIAEGEQLRAKIAFYLSLIQLDIEFNFGRHTRFLIIDSPGKEEADENYLQGFSSIITGIQQRLGDQLQILIGTAERDLEDIVEHQNITPKHAFVF